MDDGLNISQGQGEGQAQVFKPQDLSYLDRAIANQQHMQMRKEAMRQKRSSDLTKSMGSLHDLDVFYRDQPYFASKQKDLYDWAKNGNAAKIIKDGDPQAIMEFQKRVADLEQDAKLSKNAREEAEKAGNEVQMKGGFDKYVEGAEDYYHQFHEPISPEDIAAGKKPDWNFNHGNFRADIPVAKIAEEAQKLKKENIKTGGSYTDPTTGAVTSFTDEHYPRKQADEIVSKYIAANPEYYDKYHRMLNKLPAEEKDLYKTKEGYDVIKYMQDELAPALVVQNQRISHTTKGDSKNGDFNINFGNGMASTGKYNFVAQDRVREGNKSILNKLAGTDKDVPYKVISIQRTDAGENKGFFFDDPERDGKKVEVIPKEYEQNAKGDWFLIGVPKGGGKEIRIPEDKVSSDMKAITGASLEELKKGINGEVQKAAPEANEKVTVIKEGKKYKLPKSQLDKAIKQGYKLIQ